MRSLGSIFMLFFMLFFNESIVCCQTRTNISHLPSYQTTNTYLLVHYFLSWYLFLLLFCSCLYAFMLVSWFVLLCFVCALFVINVCFFVCFSAYSTYHQLLIGVLWEIVVYQDPVIRCSAGELFMVSTSYCDVDDACYTHYYIHSIKHFFNGSIMRTPCYYIHNI